MCVGVCVCGGGGGGEGENYLATIHFSRIPHFVVSRWLMGEEEGNGGNCGTSVRASISKPTPFIYLASEKKKKKKKKKKKNRLIHIRDRPKC